MATEHVRCDWCGATVLALNPRCRFCGQEVVAGVGEIAEPYEHSSDSLGIDSLSLMVAFATIAFPVHAWLAGRVAPYSVPESALQMDHRYAAAALCGLALGVLWRPKTTRGLLVLMVFILHSVAFVQMTSWRGGTYGFDLSFTSLGLLVGGCAAAAAILGGVLRGLGMAVVREAGV